MKLKKNQLKKTKKTNSSKPESTCQTCNVSHKIEITLKETNQNKL
jgi:hypothetical protein